MRLLVTGATGMLGHRVLADAKARGYDAIGTDSTAVDLTDASATTALIERTAPDAIIHCAAWTDVDGAETHEQEAQAINRDACAHVGAAATAVGARVVAVSTDYVFDGTMTRRPYVESDRPNPLGVYGRTKHAGELALAAACENHAIARTSWLFGNGGANFCDTMLNLATERDEVAVVTIQIGSPTWTGHLSPALLDLAVGEATGTFHTAGDGRVSWHGLATELFAQADVKTSVVAATASQFSRPAARPSWSVLASEREETPRLPTWQEGVRGFLQERGLYGVNK